MWQYGYGVYVSLFHIQQLCFEKVSTGSVLWRMTFLLYFSSYMTMNIVLPALNLMNAISYLLCIDSRVDIGKDSTEWIFTLDIILEMKIISKKWKKMQFSFKVTTFISIIVFLFFIGLSQSILEKINYSVHSILSLLLRYSNFSFHFSPVNLDLFCWKPNHNLAYTALLIFTYTSHIVRNFYFNFIW